MAHEYKSFNPNYGQRLDPFPVPIDTQLEAKLTAAVETFRTWNRTSYPERDVMVARAAEQLHANIDNFAKHATLEMGRLINEARNIRVHQRH